MQSKNNTSARDFVREMLSASNAVREMLDAAGRDPMVMLYLPQRDDFGDANGTVVVVFVRLADGTVGHAKLRSPAAGCDVMGLLAKRGIDPFVSVICTSCGDKLAVEDMARQADGIFDLLARLPAEERHAAYRAYRGYRRKDH
jgi:hypothetical protein